MLTIEVVLHRVLLVEDFEIIYSGSDWVVLVRDSDSEGVRFGMSAIVAAEQLVVEASGRIDSLRIVQSEEAAAVVHEIPDGLLLGIGHPFDGRFVVAIGPVHAVAQDDEELVVAEGIGIEGGDVLDESGGDVFAKESRRETVADVDGAVIAIADQDQGARA